MPAAPAKSRPYESVQVVHKTIRLRKQNPSEAEKISSGHALSSVAARVLAARGFTAGEELEDFLNPTLKSGLPDPKQLKNLDKACALIHSVIQAKKAIAICCDFDVDGLSGGAQVQHFFQTIGAASKVFVPDRFEDGYGLNEKMIRQIAAEKFGLIITIDYGTTNVKELNLARKLGVPTIVVDHHHVGDIKTPADVFINPNQKGCGFAKKILSASGLAWYLIVGLKRCLPEAKDLDAKTYLDLACLGTICDMVPLIGPNRVIAKRGLEALAASLRPGLIALKNVSGVRDRVTCADVGFGIGPRLNAAGRMVHGNVVIELLTTSDSLVSSKLAQRLNKLNTERQDTEAMVKEAALEQIRERGHLPAGLVVWDKEFHTGVVGIVAQRIVENFYRPAVVLGVDTDGVYKGSVRGIKGFNVVEALAAVSEHLIKYGGHEGAGGLSVLEEKLEDFAEAFIRECATRLENLPSGPVAEADTIVGLDELSLGLIEEFQRFAPFGMGNPNPQLLIKDLKVLDVKVLKNTHLKATLTDGKRFINGLMWRQTAHPSLFSGSTVNIVCRPDSSAYNGRVEVVANLQAVEKA